MVRHSAERRHRSPRGLRAGEKNLGQEGKVVMRAASRGDEAVFRGRINTTRRGTDAPSCWVYEFTEDEVRPLGGVT
jgi:hypothetical protein